MECERCGRCCFQPFFRNVRPGDIERWRIEGRLDLVKIFEEESQRGDHRNPRLAKLGMPLHSCRFLAPDGTGKYICEIYSFRPRTCREFEPGCSKLCPCYEAEEYSGTRHTP